MLALLADRIPPPPVRPARPAVAPARPAASSPQPPRPARYDEAGTAQAVRDVLEQVARDGATITWSELCARAGGFAELPQDVQRRILAAVRPTPGGPELLRTALLTALITTDNGTRHPYYRHLVNRSGRPFPDTATGADMAWTAAVATVHAHYHPQPSSEARPA